MSERYGDAVLHLGDCLQVMPMLEPVDAIVCDPPYGLEFMGKEWDRLGDIGKISHGGFEDTNFKGFKLASYNGSSNKKCRKCGKWAWDYPDRKCTCDSPDFPNVKGQQARIMQDWHYRWAKASLATAKPGAHLLAFGGTRTFHRLACAIEDAGWEIRDCVMWVYGSGFPKSHNLDGEWKGWGTALKPAWEPVIVARKPLEGTVAENVQRYGTGAMNIDGCRIRIAPNDFLDMQGRSGASTDNKIWGHGIGSPKGWEPEATGRWPANLIHDGSDEVVGLFPYAGGGKASGYDWRESNNSNPSHVTRNIKSGVHFGDSGSASRFFYCAKASKADRGDGNGHPTVKPTALMEYLCKLVTPPGGVVLDPFMGSGSTGVACANLGIRFIGIEIDSDYFDIACKRVGHAVKTTQPELI